VIGHRHTWGSPREILRAAVWPATTRRAAGVLRALTEGTVRLRVRPCTFPGCRAERGRPELIERRGTVTRLLS
jgi:hypothetical protein